MYYNFNAIFFYLLANVFKVFNCILNRTTQNAFIRNEIGKILIEWSVIVINSDHFLLDAKIFLLRKALLEYVD